MFTVRADFPSRPHSQRRGGPIPFKTLWPDLLVMVEGDDEGSDGLGEPGANRPAPGAPPLPRAA